MAQLTTTEKNALRKVVRLLEMPEHRDNAQWEAQREMVTAAVREMLLPTEKFVLHVPDEFAFEAKVAWYEIDGEGRKHLYLQIIETQPEAEEGNERPPAQVVVEGA